MELRWPLLFSGLAILLGIFLDLTALILLGFLAGIVIGGTAYLGRLALERVHYQRRFSQRYAFPGDELQLNIEVTNLKPLPVAWLTVSDELPEGLASDGRLTEQLYRLSWYQRVRRSYPIKAKARGAYRLGPGVLRSGDPFGFTSTYQDLGPSEELVIYPQLIDLAELPLPLAKPYGGHKGQTPWAEDLSRFKGVRPYRTGDPFNRIHWKATAVAQSLQVSEFDPQAEPRLAVVLNGKASDKPWQGWIPGEFEWNVSLAASLAEWALTERYQTGFYTNGVAPGSFHNLSLGPRRTEATLPTILEALARLHPFGSTDLGDYLSEQLPKIPYGTTLLVITRWVDPLLGPTLEQAKKSGRPPVLLFTGSPTEAPAWPGIPVYCLEVETHALAL